MAYIIQVKEKHFVMSILELCFINFVMEWILKWGSIYIKFDYFIMVNCKIMKFVVGLIVINIR